MADMRIEQMVHAGMDVAVDMTLDELFAAIRIAYDCPRSSSAERFAMLMALSELCHRFGFRLER